jgi:hypothetical protein
MVLEVAGGEGKGNEISGEDGQREPLMHTNGALMKRRTVSYQISER